MQFFSSWNWPIVLFAAALACGVIYAARRTSMVNSDDSKVFDGWVMLLSLGVYLSPFISVIGIYTLKYGANYEDEQYLRVLFIFEWAFNAVLLLMQIATAVFMLRKSRRFVPMFIATGFCKVVSTPLDFLIVVSVVAFKTGQSFGDVFNAVVPPGATNQWISMTVMVGVWVSYVRQSRRVADTFIR